jgi:ABC-type transport system involved in multi-copper enzyme maturation permease subunit
MSAEATKLLRHKATWCLVWLYPIGFTLIFTIAILVGLAGGDQRPDPPTLQGWISDSTMVWQAPGNSLGRYLIAAWVAVVFAGEYGWNTWKLIVPHRARASLIAAKYAMVVILFAFAFALTGLISVIGLWVEDLATGEAVPAGITAGLLLNAHGKGALAAAAPAFLTIGYASLAAILTRSTIAALVITIVALTVEQLLFTFAPVLSQRYPSAMWGLYHALPGYHLANLAEWIGNGVALSRPLPPAGVVTLSWGTSLAAAAAWIAAMVGLTFAAFRRQDIN